MPANSFLRHATAKQADKAHRIRQTLVDGTNAFEIRMPATKNTASQSNGKCENFVEKIFNNVSKKVEMRDHILSIIQAVSFSLNFG